MTKITLYLTPELEEALRKDIPDTGLPGGNIIDCMASQAIYQLNLHYGLIPKNTLSPAELQKKVLEEFGEYLKTNPSGEFDINAASKTYRDLDMTCGGRPAATKALLGRVIAKAVHAGQFPVKVEQVYLKNGAPKRSTGNRAALYQLV